MTVAANKTQPISVEIDNINPVVKVKNNTVNKSAKKYPLILVFGRKTCVRTVNLEKQLVRNQIKYKFRNVDDPAINKQMWEMLRRYELKSNTVSLPVVYVKGYVFLNPRVEDVKSKM